MIDLIQLLLPELVPFFLGVVFGYFLTRPIVIALPPLEKKDD